MKGVGLLSGWVGNRVRRAARSSSAYATSNSKIVPASVVRRSLALVMEGMCDTLSGPPF